MCSSSPSSFPKQFSPKATGGAEQSGVSGVRVGNATPWWDVSAQVRCRGHPCQQRGHSVFP